MSIHGYIYIYTTTYIQNAAYGHAEEKKDVLFQFLGRYLLLSNKNVSKLMASSHYGVGGALSSDHIRVLHNHFRQV